ncbi:MAG: V-type ATP synthase subunit F [Bacilli bacterium]|jgi:V/A-type H+-transporting ATPase subunit F|nr:V-type ATP synthase subunit F [Bacilli bacterium]MDD4584616.1 V-type ATP synthase subunit F [Bacilli bacterium]
MEKIEVAAIGSTDEIYLFNAVGIMTVLVQDPQEADKKVFELSQAGCKIIYLFEELYTMMGETLEKYKDKTFPIIIPIPSQKGSKGVGMKKIRDNVEKAIGMDIL